MKLLVAWMAAALPLAAASADEPLAFVRVDQSGGVDQGQLAGSYSLETAQPVVALQGSSDVGLYRGVTHRLAAAYGVLRWLTIGFEQSIRQETAGDLQVGMFSPIVRANLAGPLAGLGVYAQGRVRVSGRRPDSLVGGLAFDREAGGVRLGALLGYERAVDGTENGFRGEAGAAFRLAPEWRLAAESWWHMAWTGGGREGDFHLGPSLQRSFGVVRLGAQIGFGVESRPAMTALDTLALVRLAAGF